MQKLIESRNSMLINSPKFLVRICGYVHVMLVLVMTP
jgi:hypothetical protein